jgi:hypothetical protein
MNQVAVLKGKREHKRPAVLSARSHDKVQKLALELATGRGRDRVGKCGMLAMTVALDQDATATHQPLD